MVDLKGQYNKIKLEVDEAIQEVLDSTAFIKGPKVKTFQDNLAQYLGVKHAIGCGNGTDALQIALMALGLQPGDEVITTNFTFIATVEVIALLGLKPILVDVDQNSFNIDVELIESAITPKTKAIIPVHLFGQCSNMERIMQIADKHKLFVIEDNAQAIGSDYIFSNGTKVKSGTIGHISCTSFFPSKNLGCYGDGGAVFTNDSEIAKKIESIINHGMEVRYYHDRIGVNSRLDSIQAAVLDVKLPHLDEYCKARSKAANYYSDAFKGIEELLTPYISIYSTHVFHQYTLMVKNGRRDDLKEYLLSNGIPAMVYYPVPLDKQKAFGDWYNERIQYPVTEQLSEEVLSLPMHTELSEEQLKYITSKVVNFFDT